jgi:hypothetical protein
MTRMPTSAGPLRSVSQIPRRALDDDDDDEPVFHFLDVRRSTVYY